MLHSASLGKDEEVLVLLNVYHFRSIVRLKNPKLNQDWLEDCLHSILGGSFLHGMVKMSKTLY